MSALFLVLAACAPKPQPVGDTAATGLDETDADTDTDTDADSDSDTDTTAPCDAVVLDLSPADASFDVALDAAVVATFSAPVVEAEVGIDGVDGTMTLADDGLSATFVPTDGLALSTTYEATAIVCANPNSATFTTIGEELPVDLTGRTYDVELGSSDLTWVSPRLGAVLASSLVTNSLLFMVQSADTSRIDLLGAAGFDAGRSVGQYPCSYPVDLEPAPFTSHPAFAAGPMDTTLQANGVSFALYGLTLAGSFDDDAETVSDVVITGLLDTRTLSEAMNTDVCGLSATFGDICVACPDGEELCLAMEIHDPFAPWRPDLVLDATVDPSTDPACR